MFYDPEADDHGLPHNPFKALVAPRPIGWITTLGMDGVVNLAPYSFFNAVSGAPPCVMFSAEGLKADGSLKDSVRNAGETGEFVANLVSYDLRHAMNATSSPVDAGVDEMDLAGLKALPSRVVRPPRVADAPAHLECRTLRIIRLPDDDAAEGTGAHMVIGRVVGVHIRDDVIADDGLVSIERTRPIARLGYMDYALVREVFSMRRPG